MLGEAVRDLRGLTRGEILEPGDGAYEVARAAYNAMATGRPVAILRPADLPDIVAAVRWAAASDLAIGVRGGGHSVAGHSSPDGALLIDLSRWRGATVDPAAGTADALAGSRLMDLDAATSAHELAAPSGTYVDTGIGGLTLSGGISYLLPTEGYACDALIGAELVTAGGEVLQVDEAREPELLWALRGGGGNFGVVTHLRYRLGTSRSCTAASCGSTAIASSRWSNARSRTTRRRPTSWPCRWSPGDPRRASPGHVPRRLAR